MKQIEISDKALTEFFTKGNKITLETKNGKYQIIVKEGLCETDRITAIHYNTFSNNIEIWFDTTKIEKQDIVFERIKNDT